jgi:hypothetical protein
LSAGRQITSDPASSIALTVESKRRERGDIALDLGIDIEGTALDFDHDPILLTVGATYHF